MKCKNCANALTSDMNFCPRCGQSNVDYNKPLKPVLSEMLHESLDIDGRLFTTIRTLLLQPGELSIAYRSGQRARFTPPLRLYFVISIVFFLLLPILDPASHVVSNDDSRLVDHYSKIMFLLLPFFALLLTALFQNTFYLSNLVFSVHVHSIAYLAIALIIPLEARESEYPFLILFQFLLMGYLVVYLSVSLKRFYEQSWAKTGLKFIGLFLLYASVMGIIFDYAVHQLV